MKRAKNLHNAVKGVGAGASTGLGSRLSAHVSAIHNHVKISALGGLLMRRGGARQKEEVEEEMEEEEEEEEATPEEEEAKPEEEEAKPEEKEAKPAGMHRVILTPHSYTPKTLWCCDTYIYWLAYPPKPRYRRRFSPVEL
eukprot:2337652-Pyramimonas_sp.AAC.1